MKGNKIGGEGVERSCSVWNDGYGWGYADAHKFSTGGEDKSPQF